MCIRDRENIYLTEFHEKKGNAKKLLELDNRFHELLYEAGGSKEDQHLIQLVKRSISGDADAFLELASSSIRSGSGTRLWTGAWPMISLGMLPSSNMRDYTITLLDIPILS